MERLCPSRKMRACLRAHLPQLSMYARPYDRRANSRSDFNPRVEQSRRRAGKVGIRSTAPSAAKFLETAKRRCDLEDFGPGEFLEPLSRLLESCDREGRLNVIGKMALRSDVVRILCNRLLLTRDRQLYPGIAQQEIREPLFVV